MNFLKIKESVQSKLRVGEEGSFFPSVRSRQVVLLSGGLLIGIFGVGYILLGADSAESSGATPSTSEKKIEKKEVSQMTTPLKAVDEREIWINRIEKQVEAAKEESQQVRQENEFLHKKVDVLEGIFKNYGRTPDGTEPNQAPAPAAPLNTVQPSPQNGPQTFPPIDADIQAGGPFKEAGSEGISSQMEPKKRRRKLARLTGGGLSGNIYTNKDTYMPAGTYIRAVFLSGAVVSTATNSQGNPEPVFLRLVDDGNLPGGYKGKCKEARVIGSCYGDISSERAKCRMSKISLILADGTKVEKPIEGWVFSEDGRQGLRGQVVDRSSDIAREAFGAGLLSAAANFFKMESQRSVYPVSPFGQTNSLGTKDALAAAGSAGVGNALEKVADFQIKRAEQMQPVILINSGRVVDVVLNTGVDLSPSSEEPMKMVGAKNETQETGEE